jgi:protein gp37
MAHSSIEWTESSWNPVTGCTKVSPGCRNCYAERMAKRLKGMGQKNYQSGFEVALHHDSLDIPLKWRKPQMIFVCSMSDLFHESIPTEYILEVFRTIGQANQHTFQILTKRAWRLSDLDPELPWADNIWAGVTVENSSYLKRIELLQSSKAIVKFLSLEPLLGPIKALDLTGIDWVIVGGESGPGARPMKAEWVTSIRDVCLAEGVPFFFKQWGGVNKNKAGRLLDGRTWEEWPLAIEPGWSPC